MELLNRVLATAAVWSVAALMIARLRHPFLTAGLVALGGALTVLIWLQPVRKRPES